MNPGNFEHGFEGDLLTTWKAIFERQQAFAENAIDQLDEDGFFRTPAPGLNSVAVIVQHIAGNLHSRWTDFLTTDGEKPSRDRDAEFADMPHTAASRAALLQRWSSGWSVLQATLGELAPEDLGRTVTIRTKPHTVHGAIARSMDHIAGHVGQIQILARWHVGPERWKWFTIEPAGSAAFNQRLRGS